MIAHETLTHDSQVTADAPSDGHDVTRGTTAQLVVAHTPDSGMQGRAIALGPGLITLGRDVDPPGQAFADKQLSRLHARVMFDGHGGLHRIGDAESRNGTWVNGERVDTVLLAHGDVLRIGNTLLVYSERDVMAQMRERAARLGRSGLNLLLRGESGAGKEVIARELHAASGRHGEFVALNCAAIPRDLVAAELFGHTKHAFSGAQLARRGVFMAADGGTLLLDEIADCPLELQPALLRALQQRAIRPVGAEREIPLDVRVLSATCIDIERAVEEGRFRADLYARIAQATIELPPLRMRRDELLRLARELAPAGGPPLSFSADAAEALLLWRFPLNVRELQSLVAVARATYDDGVVDLARLAEIAPKIAEPLVARQRGARERPSLTARPTLTSPHAQLRPLLEVHAGNVAAVAQALGKPRAQVYRWMRAMGLSAERFRIDR